MRIFLLPIMVTVVIFVLLAGLCDTVLDFLGINDNEDI